MKQSFPVSDDVVLIGGGHAHALVLKAWAMNPVPGVRMTVINPAPSAPYTGMLPGYVAGHYPRGALEIDLVRLARHAGARLVLAQATGIDLGARRVLLDRQADIHFDIASVDIGITSTMPEIPGFADFAVAAKPLGPFAAAWQAHVDRVAEDGFADVAVIGGGVAGVELALAMAHRLRRLGSGGVVTVIEQSPHFLAAVGAPARGALGRHMARLGVKVLTGVSATGATPEGLRLSNGNFLRAGFVTGAAGARAHGWLAHTGLGLRQGFITVNDRLQSITDPQVFAVGDCADLAFAPRPKAGVFAVRQAPVLLANIRALLTGAPTRAFRPQRDYLKLISTGGQGAVADKYRLRLDGRWLWWLKDRIDRKFMEQFITLTAMPRETAPKGASTRLIETMTGDVPLCGGCGAKLGGADLTAALSVLPAPMRADVVSGPGDDAAVLTHGTGQQVFTTDHLRAFVDDPWLMARIAAIHALGDIWAMGAEPQAALVQLVLPRMTARLHRETLREIMQAANTVFTEAGANIVGGHTSIGAELTIGYAITGLSRSTAIGHGGGRAGDMLILTKPIGSGTVLAAEMRLAAQGNWVASVYDSMAQSQKTAAHILAPHAHAMTDVTGFGLAGHLAAILRASGVAADLNLKAVPLFDGAIALSQSGIRSSIFAPNVAAIPEISRSTDPRAALLFDPQTAGGLLAAVPAERADSLLADLESAGAQAAIIGCLKKGAPFIHL